MPPGTSEKRDHKTVCNKIFGDFYERYCSRWNDQCLTGNIKLTVNYREGGIGSWHVSDDEHNRVEKCGDLLGFTEL